MELTLFIVIITFILVGVIVYLFFPENYLKFRGKEINDRDIGILKVQAVLLFFVMIFFIMMFIKTL